MNRSQQVVEVFHELRRSVDGQISARDILAAAASIVELMSEEDEAPGCDLREGRFVAFNGRLNAQPPEKLAQSARDWLAKSESWVPVFLAFHYCANAEISETLQKLARRRGIKSYAYKAKALGFNWDMEKAASRDENFFATLLGRWLTRDLGIGVTFENKDAIHAAFKILCLEALNRVEE